MTSKAPLATAKSSAARERSCFVADEEREHLGDGAHRGKSIGEARGDDGEGGAIEAVGDVRDPELDDAAFQREEDRGQSLDPRARGEARAAFEANAHGSLGSTSRHRYGANRSRSRAISTSIATRSGCSAPRNLPRIPRALSKRRNASWFFS